jgi:hypothetical protein
MPAAKELGKSGLFSRGHLIALEALLTDVQADPRPAHFRRQVRRSQELLGSVGELRQKAHGSLWQNPDTFSFKAWLNRL